MSLVYNGFLLLSTNFLEECNMSFMKKFKQEKQYVQIPNSTAQAPEVSKNESTISLQALGLIVNLWSYNVEEWELHKTELYKRFGQNKEASVKRAWDELKEHGYILEYKVRNGRNPDYIYFYNIEPMSEQEKAKCDEQILEEYGKFTTLDFPVWKNQTGNTRLETLGVNKDIINEKQIKEKQTNNKYSQSVSLDIEESIEQQIGDIAYKVFGTKLKADGLTDIIESYNCFSDKLNLMDLLRVLRKIEAHSLKKPIKDFKNYLWASLTSYSDDLLKRTEIAQFEAKDSTRSEVLPDWFNEQETGEEGEREVLDETTEEKKRRIEEKLKKFRGEKK